MQVTEIFSPSDNVQVIDEYAGTRKEAHFYSWGVVLYEVSDYCNVRTIERFSLTIFELRELLRKAEEVIEPCYK